MYEISIEGTFDAAHCLSGYSGDCRRLHGHTYRVLASFRFRDVNESGMALDFRQAKTSLRRVLEYLDHRYINELPEFSDHSPTAENLAKFVFDRLRVEYDSIYSVSVWETATSCATYRNED